MMTCKCRSAHRDGFTNLNGWWVCVRCGFPTMGYASAMVRDTIFKNRNGEDEVGLIYFEGGPLNGYAYETQTLLGKEALDLPILEYVWTSEKKTSPATGAVAQIWRHRGVQNGGVQVSTAPPPAAANAQTTPAPAPAAPEAAHAAAPSSADEAPAAVTGVVQPPAPAASDDATEEDLGDLDGPVLMARREAMKKPKVSRGKVSEISGLAQSKIWAIETNNGKRVKLEERRKYAEALAKLEAERGIEVGSGAGAHS